MPLRQDVERQVYERAAITRWINERQRVPHSPDTICNLADLTPLPYLADLLKHLRKRYIVRVSYDTDFPGHAMGWRLWFELWLVWLAHI